MKVITAVVLALLIFGTAPAFAQDIDAKDLAVRLDATTGKIDLVHRTQNTVVTQDYQLDELEIMIFDANGEYAGTLKLKEFAIPQNEVDASEKVKVSKMTFRHAASGKAITLANVSFEP